MASKSRNETPLASSGDRALLEVLELLPLILDDAFWANDSLFKTQREQTAATAKRIVAVDACLRVHAVKRRFSVTTARISRQRRDKTLLGLKTALSNLLCSEVYESTAICVRLRNVFVPGWAQLTRIDFARGYKIIAFATSRIFLREIYDL